MGESTSTRRWRPARASVIAGALVVAGFLLASVSWWFILLAAAGTFGPGILRELGLLEDKDEFQRRADHRAGYHAWLTAGVAAFALVAFFRSGNRVVAHTEELATLFLALLWFSWFLSSLLSYWGPRKAAARILVAFGAAWLLFVILSNVGSEWTGWGALLLHPLLTVPFFALAWTAGRWPRVTGLLLIASGVGLAGYLGLFGRSGVGLVNRGLVLLLFLGPLVASGIALLASGPEGDDAGDARQPAAHPA